MKHRKPFLIGVASLSFSLFLFSCNSETTTPKEETKAAAETPAPAPAAEPKEQTFDVMEISHTVKDYATWRPFFNSDATNRKAAGLEDLAVGQSIDNPNNVIIYLKATDLEKAKQFSANPLLKEVMGKAGVTGKPEIKTYHVLRNNPDAKEKQWVTVTHRVKDFDSWLKVYDGEGKEKRASQGMIDAALARSTEDPNMVLIVFDVTDLEKAKTAISSEEKKQLMLSAGVEGKPTIQFYNTAKE